MVVAGFDASGQAVFAKAYGDDSNFTLASAMTAMPDGNLLLSGPLSGAIDFGGGAIAGVPGYLVALSPSGAEVWARPIESSAVTVMAPSKCYVRIAGLAGTGAKIGNGVIPGEVDPNGFENGFEAVLSPAGDLLGSQRFVGTTTFPYRPSSHRRGSGEGHSESSTGSRRVSRPSSWIPRRPAFCERGGWASGGGSRRGKA